MLRRLLSAWGVVFLCGLMGCGAKENVVQLDAETRMARLLNLYQAYDRKNRRGPPSEDVLKEFAQKLSTKEREDFAIGQDLESIFVSPRDNQKFQVRYNVRMDATQTRAIAWEATAHNGLRLVALSNGYTTTCDEETFKQYNK
jgi:hypothetical protein